MLSLYEILKASKTSIAPDMWTALAGANFGGAGSGAETKELTGIPPLSIRSNGTIMLDYLISGNMSQNGTPTPTTPIQPQETGERTGNLFDKGLLVDAKGIFLDGSVVDDPNRTCTVNAISVSDSSYVLSWVSDNVLAITATYNNGNLVNRVASLTSPTVIDTTGATELRVVFYKTNVQITKNDVSNVMLNSGSTALPYEPYGQYKIPISSANTTTPIYLGEVPTTRRIRKLVLTGEEIWGRVDNCFRLSLPNSSNTVGIIISTHFEYKIPWTLVNTTSVGACISTTYYGTAYKFLMIRCDDIATTATDFKEWLASQYANGTPVCVWYVLATEETGIVNEPLRKIGDYADTVSYEQAGVQIPTVKGNTVIDVETTLKPSEMYIKYQE